MMIQGTSFSSQDNQEVILYSEKGNVSVFADNININGIIYAPNGMEHIKGKNVTINGMIVADRIHIDADNVIINENLELSLASNFVYYNEALQVYANGEFNSEDNAISLNWQSTFDEGTFDIFTSTDGISYVLLDSVTGVNTYAYPVGEATNDIYFKVKQTLNNGFSKESNYVKMVYNTEIGEYELEEVDTDGEGVIDTYEFFLETDKNNIDTDGDGLSDYAEVFLTGTDPLYKDSDENGVLDPD